MDSELSQCVTHGLAGCSMWKRAMRAMDVGVEAAASPQCMVPLQARLELVNAIGQLNVSRHNYTNTLSGTAVLQVTLTVPLSVAVSVPLSVTLSFTLSVRLSVTLSVTLSV